MDKNQITGLVLMLALMAVYFQFFAPEEPDQPVGQEAIGASANPEAEQQVTAANMTPTTVNGPLDSATHKENYGVFAPFAIGNARDVNIENESVKITLSSRGGAVKHVELKDYLTYSKDPLVLVDENSSQSDLMLTSNYKPINVSELYYKADYKKLKVMGTDSLAVSFRVVLDGGGYLEHKYTLGVPAFS